jgi:hypothetical protein
MMPDQLEKDMADTITRWTNAQPHVADVASPQVSGVFEEVEGVMSRGCSLFDDDDILVGGWVQGKAGRMGGWWMLPKEGVHCCNALRGYGQAGSG